MAAGLDVFAEEPEVPEELLAMENVVLLPHVGSGSEFTREKMDQLMVDNILRLGRRQAAAHPGAGDAVARLEYRSGLRLFRGDPHFRRGGAHVGIDVVLELHEVLLEHVDQLARGLVELRACSARSCADRADAARRRRAGSAPRSRNTDRCGTSRSSASRRARRSSSVRVTLIGMRRPTP